MRITRILGLAAGLLAAGSFLAGASAAEDPYHPSMTKCTMVYNLKGWSFVVKSSSGQGKITCDNGQRAEVTLEVAQIGFTIGVSEIIGGRATFTSTRSISDLYGYWAATEAHAGATVSAHGSVMTKGNISMAVSGTGRGIDLGVTIGSFRIAPK